MIHKLGWSKLQSSESIPDKQRAAISDLQLKTCITHKLLGQMTPNLNSSYIHELSTTFVFISLTAKHIIKVNFVRLPKLSRNQQLQEININLYAKHTFDHNQYNHHKVHIK
jgi:hypothetical protein